MNLKGTAITWLGHSTVLIATDADTTVLIDPFISNNPQYPKEYQLPDKIDLILASHGHGDHIGDLLPIASGHGSTVIGMPELVTWAGSMGISRSLSMNIGGSWSYKDVTISMVDAKHSSGIDSNSGLVYGGSAAGFVISVQNGPTLYHAGDTDVFLDMQIIRELYRPELAMLPIGGHYTMGPRGAALAATYLQPRSVLPIHFGTFPVLVGTPHELIQHLSGSGIEVHLIEPGDSIR